MDKYIEFAELVKSWVEAGGRFSHNHEGIRLESREGHRFHFIGDNRAVQAADFMRRAQQNGGESNAL